MKIYIDNYKPCQLLFFLSSLEKYLYSKEEYIELYSDTGQYLILKDKIFQVFITDVPIINKKLGDNGLIILDKSNVNLIPTVHIPNNHITIPMSKYKYKMENNPLFFLVIEGYTGDQEHFIPSNFYFEFNEEKVGLENCIENLNEFLFILNKY